MVEAPVYQWGDRGRPRPKISQGNQKHSMAEVEVHSLQVAVQEFKKIHDPKISKLKGGYSANTALIFKDIDMCVHDHNLTEHEAV